MDEVQYSATEQASESDNEEIHPTEELDEVSLSGEDESVKAESEGVEDMEGVEDVVGGCKFDNGTAVNGIEDMAEVDFRIITAEDVMRFHFQDTDVAFIFYNWYTSVNGFATSKSKVMRNSHGEVTQQTFLSHKEGIRQAKHTNNTRRIRRPKPVTRCGCEARCVVHVDQKSGRWYIKMFDDVHNHTLMDPNFSTMLPAHRKMSDYDKFQMISMRKVGIKTSHMYGFFATQAGGYDNLGYMRRDMYNEQVRLKRIEFTDATSALDFLE